MRTLHDPERSSVVICCKIVGPAQEFLCFACIDVVVIFINKIRKENCTESLQT